MSKSRLISGRVKKLTGSALDPNRTSYLSVDNAEPDLGLPSINGQVLVSTDQGIRSWTTVSFALAGPNAVYQNQVVPYVINDYDTFTTYSVSVTDGTTPVGTASANITRNIITLTAPATTGTIKLNLSNGTLSRSVEITVLTAAINKPSITSPNNGSKFYLGPAFVPFTSTAFQALGLADTHSNSDWQLATDEAFTAIVDSLTASTEPDLTTWTVTITTPAIYYVRVRHSGLALGPSSYSDPVQVLIVPAAIAAPTITNPMSGTGNYPTSSITFTSSAFTYLGSVDNHLSSDWQLATDAAFTTIVQSSSSTANRTTWAVTGLNAATLYYVRVRHRGGSNTSEYSSIVNFFTINEFESYIPTPAATPAIGASFEGGFYAGMIWNQATTSGSSATLSTGVKTFTVLDMTSTPIFYQFQEVEVRVLSSPTIRMFGTVFSAGSTTLKISVDRFDGFQGNAYNNWAIMVRYRIIVAPKSQGGQAYDLRVATSVSTVLPDKCRSLTEGYESTQAMIRDGVAKYPFANFCNNINTSPTGINDYKDWYIPARDELELCFRNLRPNNQSTNTPARGTPIYSMRSTGEFPDQYDYLGYESATGTNRNSIPPTISYYASRFQIGPERFPPQTTVPNFQQGGIEAFGSSSTTSLEVLSSTSTGTGDVYAIDFVLGGIEAESQTNVSNYTRLVRRSVI